MGKWELVRLGDIGTIVTGSTPPKKEAIFYDSDDIPFFKPNDFSEDTIEKLTIPNEYVSEKARKKIRLLPVGSVLVTCIGTIGKVGIATCESTCNQQINAIIPHDKVIISEYLANVVLTRRAYLKQIANAPVVPIINKSNFSEVLIPLPPLDEQKRIAKNLDLASEIVKGYKEQLTELDKLVQSVFYEMFGDPVTNEKGWKVQMLGDITSLIQSGNTPKGGKQVYTDSGIMFFRSQNVWRNRIELDDIAYIDENTHKKMNKTSLKHNDILITKTGRFNTENSSLGRAAIYLGSDNSANINGHVYLVRLKAGNVHKFILYILTTNEYREYIRKVCVGGIDKRQINKEHLEKFPIIVPPYPLQTHFASIVTEIEAQKEQAKQALTEAESLFNSLMQEYFE